MVDQGTRDITLFTYINVRGYIIDASTSFDHRLPPLSTRNNDMSATNTIGGVLYIIFKFFNQM